MAGKGGARPGAGRKRAADKYATAINQAERRIADRLPDLIDKLFELADGVTVMERDAHGREKVYDRPPDFKAASYLVDRVMGKPAQKLEAEHTGKDGEPLTLGYVILPPVMNDAGTSDPNERED